MSRRPSVLPRGSEQERSTRALPQARDVVLPELVGGLAGAPLQYARSFHQFFFDHAERTVADRGLLVLQHIVIGHACPLLREVQLWGSAVDPVEMIGLTSDEIADEFGLDAEIENTICTERPLFVGAVDAAPCLGDAELERDTIARLLISTTASLATVAPYVRIGDGVVWPYRPSNTLTLLGRIYEAPSWPEPCDGAE